jgi:hypothetical protein
MDFPPNSKKSQEGASEAPTKRVERVTSGEAQRRKKRPRFRDVFFGGDARTAWEYNYINVIVPQIQELLLDSIMTVAERVVKGDTHTRRRRGGPVHGGQGYIAYNQRPEDRPPMPQMSRRARARHDFDDIVLASRVEAEEVIDRLFDLISRYEAASVADLYALVGIQASHTDQKWGWIALPGANATRIRTGGYLLNLPSPVELD